MKKATISSVAVIASTLMHFVNVHVLETRPTHDSLTIVSTSSKYEHITHRIFLSSAFHIFAVDLPHINFEDFVFDLVVISFENHISWFIVSKSRRIVQLFNLRKREPA